jgi:hypothetical protein
VPSEWLKKIKEKYNGNTHVLSPRSDVVKLARALDLVSEDLEGSNLLFAKRTLEEVAGEPRPRPRRAKRKPCATCGRYHYSGDYPCPPEEVAGE